MDTIPTAKEKQNCFVKKEDKTPPKCTTKDATINLYRVFSTVGVYKPENSKYGYYLWATFIHFSVTLYLPFAFIASYFVKTDEEIEYDTLLTSIQVVFNVVGSSTKICMLLHFVPQLKSTETITDELDARCVDEDEIELLHKLKSLGNKLVVNFAIIYWSYSTSTFIAGIMAGHPPFSLYFPYMNWHNSHWEFIVVSIIEFLLMDGACLQEVANDGYAAVYVCVLRTHVNILRLRIQKLCTKPEKTLEENLQDLKMCIKDHKNIIKLYNIISPVISATIFLQFNITAVMVGITMINVSLFSKNFSSKVASFFYVLGVVNEIFPLCYYANCLIYDSDRLNEDIFHSQWVQQNERYRKMLILFMQRSQQTMTLTAGKIFPINLNTFIGIAKLSMSLYTLIKKMNIKEKLLG